MQTVRNALLESSTLVSWLTDWYNFLAAEMVCNRRANNR